MRKWMSDDCSLPEQVAQLRENHPQWIALRHGGRRLSYEQLDSRADHFAGYLLQLGLERGGTVAICMERSFDWIVAALGVLRAGAAYVPLDPAWPDSRIRFALEDSAASALVARTPLLDHLQPKVPGIDPCRDAAAIGAAPDAPRKSIPPDSLAYVIYTSGSTGVPKGVEITHGNLAHLIRWHCQAFGVTEKDCASHLAGLGFDAAVWEVWPYLAAGATVCLAEDAVRSSPELIREWVLRERVTMGFVPTVHAKPMMEMAWPAATPLRYLLTGGDTLRQGPPPNLPFEVVNNYGPTECTVVATSTVLEPGRQGAPPIGAAITGATLYLLDEKGQPVPDGSTGEIYIGGGGVGRGYRNLPEATERSFRSDPFAADSNARMYRTGDRGVRRADGQIEFCGRLDRQTKIRGQRVELDEIASVMAGHPDVDFATAMVIAAPDGENQLVGYVLPKENAAVPTAHELKQFLLPSLPDYMVPAIFVRLEHLPLSPNGKIDLAKLPSPADAPLLEGRAEKAPASAIEGRLVTMVRKLLSNDAVTAEDSFFLAGGHSLLGMQLLIQLRETFGVELTLRQLFEAPTVESLAVLVQNILDEQHLAAIWAEVLGAQNIGREDNFFEMGGDSILASTLKQRIAAEFGQSIEIGELFENPTVRSQTELLKGRAGRGRDLPQGVVALQPKGTRSSIFWLHYLSVDLAKVIGDSQPFFSVALAAKDIAELGEKPTLQSIAACLLRKIVAIQPNGPYTIGGLCLGGILAYEIAAQLKAAGEEIQLLVLVDPPNPSYMESCDSLTRTVDYLVYAVKRMARLGLRTSFLYLSKHVLKGFARTLRTKSTRSEVSVAQEMSEAAMFAYRPEKYEGEVLLLLASERPPHVDYVPGWQAVVPRNLHIQYVNAHHRDLLKGEHVRSVADAIVSHLDSATAGQAELARAFAPEESASTGGTAAENPAPFLTLKAPKDGRPTPLPLT